MMNSHFEPDKVILVDTRQREGKHATQHKQLEKLKYKIENVVLNVGDYMIPGGNITVDTKRNLQEVANNLGADRLRFHREALRATENNLKLVVLVEERGYKCLDDVANWVPQHGKISGRKLRESMETAQNAWGVQWEFCDKRSTGRRIIEILEGCDEKGEHHAK